MLNTLTSKFFYNLEFNQILSFFVAMLITYMITPFVRSRAMKLGVLDKPSKRRIHKQPTPRLGGISIFVGLFLTCFIFIAAYLKYFSLEPRAFPLLGILAGGSIIFLLGLLDDIEPVPPIYKLLAQILAASVAWYLGVRIEHIVNPMYHADLVLFKFSVGDQVFSFGKILSYALTVMWIVIITNAINLLDGMDGLATGVSLISAIAIWSVATGARIDEPSGALLAAILAGCLLGFLRWNFNPARIFLGDSGAYLTGFMLASLAISCVMKSLTLVIMTPMLILIFALPILDTLFAVVRRIIGKRSILKPDKEHIHHRILASGISQKGAAYFFYLVSFLLGLWGTYLMSMQTFYRFSGLIFLVMCIILFFTFVINWRHQKIFKTKK